MGRYNWCILTHCEHVRSVFQDPIVKANNGRELRKPYGVHKEHISASELLDHYYTLDTFLTIAMELKMNEVTRLKWMKDSNYSQTTPSYTELLKFLNLQARHLNQ